jgi:hypothetical protein
MVWVLEKKVFHHRIDLGFESIEIPIRVKFEFEVRQGAFVQDSILVQSLYNKKALEKRYPKLKGDLLESRINKTVEQGIHSYLKECGYLDKE